jgi:integrase/recombinase XerD
MKPKMPPRLPIEPKSAKKASHSGPHGKAKILSPEQLQGAIDMAVGHSTFTLRDKLYLLLSHYCGLRAQEIAYLWVEDITDVTGVIGDAMYISKRSAKYGKERTVPLVPAVRDALIEYVKLAEIDKGPIFWTYKGSPVTPNAVQKQIAAIYSACDYKGASSHSGRRQFITKLAQKANTVGASIKDVQILAGHADLKTTEGYIDPSPHAAALVNLL